MQNQGGYNEGMNEWELCAEWVTHHTYTLQWGACKYLKNSLGKTSLCQWLNSIKPQETTGIILILLRVIMGIVLKYFSLNTNCNLLPQKTVSRAPCLFGWLSNQMKSHYLWSFLYSDVIKKLMIWEQHLLACSCLLWIFTTYPSLYG